MVVRDITDIAHPTTVSVADISSMNPRFVSATDVSYITADGHLVRLVFNSADRMTASLCARLFDWSRDGTTLVYLNETSSGMVLHKVTGPQDRELSSIPGLRITGCQSRTCTDRQDARLLFSPDASHVSLVENWGGPVIRLWTSDGGVVKAIDSASLSGAVPPGMAVWSGQSFYFRNANGVSVWNNGVVSSFLPGVAWLRPKASPGGQMITYAARDSGGSAHTYVVDISSRQVRELKADRSEPIFLTARYIWFRAERSCVAADQCEPSLPVVPSGNTYVYDLQDGTETGSLITYVADVWPHPA
jgi:hypothetical protein